MKGERIGNGGRGIRKGRVKRKWEAKGEGKGERRRSRGKEEEENGGRLKGK